MTFQDKTQAKIVSIELGPSFTARAIVQLYVNVMARDGFSREGDDGDDESEESMNDRGAVDFREVLYQLWSLDPLTY